MKCPQVFAAAALLSAVAFPLPASADPSYTVTKLADAVPLDGHTYAYINAINNAGVGAGTLYDWNGGNVLGAAATFSNGEVKVLSAPADGGIYNVGIADSGTVGGSFCTGSGCGVLRMADGQTSVLRNPVVGSVGIGGATYASAMNNRGDIVATAELGGPGGLRTVPLLYQANSAPVELKLGHQYVTATGINDLGHIAGYYVDSAHAGAILYSGGKVYELDTPGHFSHAWGLNNADMVAGSSAASIYDAPLPTLFANGKAITLSDQSGEALAVNNAGVVVGGFGLAHNEGAFVWANGQLQQLDALVPAGWKLQTARDINDNGQILAYGSFGDDGPGQILLLSPSSISPVPEPAPFALLVCGLALDALLSRPSFTRP